MLCKALWKIMFRRLALESAFFSPELITWGAFWCRLQGSADSNVCVRLLGVCASAGTYKWCITQQFLAEDAYSSERTLLFGCNLFYMLSKSPLRLSFTAQNVTCLRKTCNTLLYWWSLIAAHEIWDFRDCWSRKDKKNLSICELFKILSKLNWSCNSTRRMHNDPRFLAQQKNASHLAFHSVGSLQCAAMQRDSRKQQCN